VVSRPTGRFSIFSPFVDSDLLAGYPSAHRASARHRRCRLRIITSLLLPSPEEVWEPYCSRKPSLTLSLSLSFSLVSLCPIRSLLLSPPCFYSHPASSSIFPLPRLPPVSLAVFYLLGGTQRVAHVLSSFVPIR